MAPSIAPSIMPTVSAVPTTIPSIEPSDVPSIGPSESPSKFPSASPSDVPSLFPSQSPSDVPSSLPSQSPSDVPSLSPSDEPSFQPSDSPTNVPSDMPSSFPSDLPSLSPSNEPSVQPPESSTEVPTASPSESPTAAPSSTPTESPSGAPSVLPSATPTTTFPPNFVANQVITVVSNAGLRKALVLPECGVQDENAKFVLWAEFSLPSANRQTDKVYVDPFESPAASLQCNTTLSPRLAPPETATVGGAKVSSFVQINSNDANCITFCIGLGTCGGRSLVLAFFDNDLTRNGDSVIHDGDITTGLLAVTGTIPMN
eukprot:scaffold1240_cov138-Amphora_coffeaeformis.AAC.1